MAGKADGHRSGGSAGGQRSSGGGSRAGSSGGGPRRLRRSTAGEGRVEGRVKGGQGRVDGRVEGRSQGGSDGRVEGRVLDRRGPGRLVRSAAVQVLLADRPGRAQAQRPAGAHGPADLRARPRGARRRADRAAARRAAAAAAGRAGMSAAARPRVREADRQAARRRRGPAAASPRGRGPGPRLVRAAARVGGAAVSRLAVRLIRGAVRGRAAGGRRIDRAPSGRLPIALPSTRVRRSPTRSPARSWIPRSAASCSRCPRCTATWWPGTW